MKRDPAHADVVDRTVQECKQAHQSDTYFDMAEPYMQKQWDWHIWPAIKDADFQRVLELAPGYGRNTSKLIGISGEIHLVDVNQSCIDRCRQRFAKHPGPCKLQFTVNDGKSLAGIPSDYFTLVYSWDAMVHFDRMVVRQYLLEFSRVMAHGARGFVHHSNYGIISTSEDWQKNPAWRSNMTAELFRQYAAEAGLQIDSQHMLDWEGITHLDCISNFRKP